MGLLASNTTHLTSSTVKREATQNSVSKTVKEPGTDVANEPMFENPFAMEDLMVFDDRTLRSMLEYGDYGLHLPDLAKSLHGTSSSLVERIRRNMPPQQQAALMEGLRRPYTKGEVEVARKHMLDGLFWELTYWKTPELYEELTEGEKLHPGIFERLGPELEGKSVVDVGAGSGRATFECVRYGAKLVYAIEPSPGLLRILERKQTNYPAHDCIISLHGRFHAIPLPEKSVDITLSCSAFTAESQQGGEAGLAEMKRVTRTGGKIILIWPRIEDYDWLIAHGFSYVSLSVQEEIKVRFRSLESALRCARHFYAHNWAVEAYILDQQQPEVPFSLLGFNPPHEYCWLSVP